MRPFTRTRAIAALALVAAAALAVPIGAVGQEPTVREPMTFGYEPPPGWSSEDVVDTRPYETNIPWSICFANGHPLGAWRIQSIRSLENEVQLYPDLIEDFTRTDDEGDPTRLAEDITDCVVRGVDAILVVPIDDPAVAEAVKAAQDAGVPVVAFHEPLQGTDVTAYVGTDVCQKGSQLADWLIANVPTESRVIALGDEGTHGRQAWACAERALVDGGLEVLEYRDTYGDPIAAEEVCAELLATHPRIDGIWSDTGEAGMGCVTAFRTAGRPLVPVTGDDYNGLLRLYSELSAEEPGFAIGTLSDPTDQGAYAIQMVMGILNGDEDVPVTAYLTPLSITGENVADHVRPDLPDEVHLDTNLGDVELVELFPEAQS